jgi:ABC-2 type transport system permease protein
MLRDIGVVMWKEWQELWIAIRTRASLIRLLVWMGIFGVMLPSQSGPFWLRSPMTLYFWVWFPMFFTSAAVTGAFAREREHHTLETLLATRLSDRAILWGKTATAVAYGWGLDLACALLGWVVINVQHPGLHLVDPALAMGGFVLSLLTASLVAGAGVMISMGAPTYQAASQGMTIVILLLFVPALALDLLPPPVVATVQARVLAADVAALAAWGTAVLLPANADVVAAALFRFQRSRLLLT